MTLLAVAAVLVYAATARLPPCERSQFPLNRLDCVKLNNTGETNSTDYTRNCFNIDAQDWDKVMNDDSYSIHSCEEACFEEIEERFHGFNKYKCQDFCGETAE